MRRKRLWVALLLLLALVLSLPLLLNLEMFRTPVHRALERQMGRRVDFARLTARLLPRPGIVGRGVVVHEEESFGQEAFLFADEAQCSLSLGRLWHGEVECTEIRFLRPSINLVRRADGQWNLAQFLQQHESSQIHPPPAVSLQEGRINVMFGPDKQVVALSDARARIEPESNGRWLVTLNATPLRLDRRLNETGELRLRGEAIPGSGGSAPAFRFNAGVEKGSLSQWWVLFTGSDLPVRAQASLQARLEGTPADWRARGTLNLSGLRRWDLLAAPRSPNWDVAFQVRRLAAEDTLVIEDAAVKGQQSEVQFSGRVDGPFAQPHWTLEAASDHLALEELGIQFAGLRPDVASGLRWEGTGQLALSINGSPAGLKGTLTVPAGAALHVPGLSQPIQFGQLLARCDRGRLTLEPLAAQFSPTNALSLSGEVRLDTPEMPYRLHWQGTRIDLESLWRTAEALGWNLFEQARWEGTARIDLEWRGRWGEASPWQGTVQLTEARYSPPEFNTGLSIPSARLVWSGPALQVQPLQLQLGENRLEVSATRRRPDEPWNLNLTGARLSLADLNALVNPAQRGLFERLVRSESGPEPNWIRGGATGKLSVDEVTAGPFRLRGVEAEGEWKEGVLSFQRLRFRAYAGRFDGRFHADFRNSPPRYVLAGNVRQMAVAGLLADTTSLGTLFTGLASAEVALESAGSRPRDLTRNLQGRVVGGVNHGAITHVDVLHAMAAAAGDADRAAASDGSTAMESLVGEFQIEEQQVEFSSVQLICKGAALELSGRVGFDRSLELVIRGEPLRVAGRELPPVPASVLTGVYRLTGTLERPEVQVVEPPKNPAAPSAASR